MLSDMELWQHGKSQPGYVYTVQDGEGTAHIQAKCCDIEGEKATVRVTERALDELRSVIWKWPSIWMKTVTAVVLLPVGTKMLRRRDEGDVIARVISTEMYQPPPSGGECFEPIEKLKADISGDPIHDDTAPIMYIRIPGLQKPESSQSVPAFTNEQRLRDEQEQKGSFYLHPDDLAADREAEAAAVTAADVGRLRPREGPGLVSASAAPAAAGGGARKPRQGGCNCGKKGGRQYGQTLTERYDEHKQAAVEAVAKQRAAEAAAAAGEGPR